MSKTRNNHYVPQWYQEGFFEPGENELQYLDLAPPQRILKDGRVITERALFSAPTSRCFRQTDLYSTFFGSAISDDIERNLFGAVDVRGAKAVRAFRGVDPGEWHRHFHALFEFLDTQKIRTPKGLDWLKGQYPELSQNELMSEMAGIRMMHCTIWTECVREIVSAEDAGIKFLISDHPVTIYNYVAQPSGVQCQYPHDPGIELKGSQTIFPLNRDFCLILTNLEYAQNPDADPLEKRTFARKFRESLVRTDALIRTRKLTDAEVATINYVVKYRARRYIAAGRKEWLYPEKIITGNWANLRDKIRPKDELWRFGGEIFVGLKDGRVHYQDAFGRTEHQREILIKEPKTGKIRAGDVCGCGSGKRFDKCCMSTPEALRPTWSQLSIRERNLALYRGITNILGIDKGKDWTSVRRDLSNDQISQIYFLYEILWPLETDLLQLLAKPDGRARAVYTGDIHPNAICEFAFGASLYFGELIIETPFLHNGALADAYKPVKHPNIYRYEFLKSVLFFLNIMPLVARGLVNLIPNPCDFDFYLRRQMMAMANDRAPWLAGDVDKEVRSRELAEEDMKRNLIGLPRDVLRAQLQVVAPELDDSELEETLIGFEQLREQDPLADLSGGAFVDGAEGGQLNHMRLAPNFEMAMYIAQATGSTIVTDSPVRWNEILRVIRRLGPGSLFGLSDLSQRISGSEFLFPSNVAEILALSSGNELSGYSGLFRAVSRYLPTLATKGVLPNVEENLSARFSKLHLPAQALISKLKGTVNRGRVACAFPVGGFQHNTINRLLLMSSSERHLPRVPTAFFIKRV